jgi:hypothetical protein
MNKHLTTFTSMLAALGTLVVNAVFDLVARIPGIPDVRSLDFLIFLLNKIEQRLSTVTARATARADALTDLASECDDKAELLFDEADHAMRVQSRLRMLLR